MPFAWNRKLSWLLALLLPAIVAGQPNYRIIDFEKLNNSVTQVNRIARDGQGMMWFGTNDGLYRYDGYEFRNFKSKSGDGVNMPSNNISYMYASSEGSIWCVVSNRAFLFDTHTYRYLDVMGAYEKKCGHEFKVVKLRTLGCGTTWLFTDDGKVFSVNDARPMNSLKLVAENEKVDNVTAICDAKERSWVLTGSHTFMDDGKKLSRFNQVFDKVVNGPSLVWLLDAEGRLFQYQEDSGKIVPVNAVAGRRVADIAVLRDGTTALMAENGLLLLSTDGKRLVTTTATTSINKIMEDGNGHIWLLAKDGRLFMTDGNFRTVTPIEGLKTEKCNLMHDPSGINWFFTENDGAYYSLKSQPARLVKFEGDKLQGDINNTVDDGQGGYWFTHRSRAYRLTFESPHFTRLELHQPDQVRCVAKDAQGRILVGTRFDETVTVFQPDGQRMGWLTPDGRISHQYTSFGASVYSACLTHDGTLWLGTKRHGVIRLRPRTEGGYVVDRYASDPKHPELSPSDNEVYAFAADKHDRLWVGTHRGGLCCIEDLKADVPRFVRPDNGLKGWTYGQQTSVRTLMATDDNLLLVGCFGGFYVADISGRDLAKVSFQQHRREPDREGSLSSGNITGIVQSSQGRHIFLSTNDGGLDELLSKDLKAKQLEFRHYNLQTGYPSDILLSVIESGGYLWTPAPDKLLKLQWKENSQQQETNSFLMRERPKFSLCQPLAVSKGTWLFGTDDGALMIDLDDLNSSSFVPPLVVTGVSVENSPLDFAVEWGDTVTLGSRQRDLTLWFSALDYENTELVTYAYRMDEGKPWTYIGQNHSVTLAQLQPGTYHITVRSTNSDGVWCDNQRQLTIIVKPRFTETAWFYLLLLALLAAIAGTVAYTLSYIRRIKRQQHETMEAYLALIEAGHQQAPAEVEEQEDTPPLSDTSPEDEKLMKQLMTFIEQNIHDADITIDDMASAINVSRSGLHRKVKHLVGKSPMEFMREARIRRASQMLTETAKSVSEIAYACGFSDPKYFSKCFKQATGMTPTQFKETPATAQK